MVARLESQLSHLGILYQVAYHQPDRTIPESYADALALC
jgi:hypothetical protein